MTTQSHVSTPQKQLSCPVFLGNQATETRLVAHWFTDKEGKLFRSWIREAIASK
ncbi:hypothetical protein [[Limnothrix rosea] IAM M-220]|uniref:hypothetical protein n=1 Tax=[Limnothrix rosea] IAM M-220 TaxID=454133 RepID=UPI0015C58302|nr:hypothetical protein [[Limnothrix rosea] IAM M-220]